MKKEHVFFCPDCGSTDVELYDKSYSDNGAKMFCNSCGRVNWEKSFDDFQTMLCVTRPKHKARIRTRASRRRMDFTKAIRKKGISDNYVGGTPYYNNLHQYSKNKIHCSCPLCAAKSRDKTGLNLKVSEVRNAGLNNMRRQKMALKKICEA